MRRILVATWGNPFQWENIKYRVDCGLLGVEDCRDVEMKNVSTLPVLIKALRPDKTIVLVLDTLVNVTWKKRDNDGERIIPDIPEREIESYYSLKEGKDSVIGDVRERVEWFIENEVKPLLSEEDRSLLEGVNIAVLPGVGEFPNASVMGDVLDFYAAALKILAEKLPEGETEVVLDLTHGINFMPVLTYRALKNLLGILAYLHEARLYVVNSEPFPQGWGKWKEDMKRESTLHIKLVEALELRPKPLYSPIPDKPEWSAFISSVTNGFPLAFATFYPWRKDIEEYIDRHYSEFLGAIEATMEVDKAGKRKVHVRRKKPLGKDFRTAVKLYYMLRVFGTVFKGYPKTGSKKKVTLDELFEISSKLFARMPRIGIVVEDQLCELKNLQEWAITELGKRRKRIPKSLLDKLRKLEKAGILLGELYQARNQDFTSSGGPINKNIKVRNFIAHSGFEFNTVSVKLEDTIKDGEVKKVFVFSYRDKELASQLCIDALTYRNQEVNC